VVIENIHTRMTTSKSIATAVKIGTAETVVPNLLAMLCVLAVFLPSFLMEGASRGLFVPLAIAVGFAMFTAFMLSITFVPVMSIWLLRHFHHAEEATPGRFSFARIRQGHAHLLQAVLRFRWILIPSYLVIAFLVLSIAGLQVGREIAPSVDSGQFQLRIRTPTGTHIYVNEDITRKTREIINEIVGPENVDITVAYVGVTAPTYTVN
jgi:multidrug efflux pump subunit AcrB